MSASLARRSLADAVPAGGEPTYRRLGALVGRVLSRFTREDWDDAAALPATGGVLIVSNHVSYVDPLAVGRYLIWHGRWPRFLGKADLWRIPGISALAKGCGQIPVARGTSRAKDSLAAAIAAVRAGECVAIYPEGTRTRDPELWPMLPRTGAARLALTTGAPVVPVTHWGTHDVMPGRRLSFPRVFPPRRIVIRMGQPVDLADLGHNTDPESVHEAGRRIMAAITAGVEQLRGEPAPEGVWDGRRGVRVERL